MFDSLKKKISSFVSGLTKKEEEKPLEAQPEKPAEEPVQAPAGKPVEEPAPPEEPAAAPVEKPVEAPPEKTATIEEEMVREAEREAAREAKPVEPTAPAEPAEAVEPVKPVEPPEPAKPVEQPKEAEREPAEQKPLGQEPVEQKPGVAFEVREEKKELKPKLGLLARVKSVFTGSVTISEKETRPLLEDLQMALLESDVSFDTAQYLVEDLRKRLAGKRVAKNVVEQEVRSEVRNALLGMLSTQGVDLVEAVRNKPEKPCVIFFLGPNGSGKTTTIAKIAFLLQKHGLKSVIAASDTFRAAAIHQAQEHADKLGVKLVKHDYGADPTAVAFDAIAHAKAHKVDAVLVDTAGRQETNYNLVKEMEKMNRVLNPDLKVFVGEAIAGHAIVEQLKKMSEAVGGIDGVILTKIDCDAKGGNTLSVAREAGAPVLFIGTGQEYGDLKPFEPEWVVDNIVPAA